MKNEWALKGITKTGEEVSIEPYITDRDVKVLKREPYSNGGTSGLRMSVEVTRVEPHEQPPLDIRAVTTGRIERAKTATGYHIRHQHETKFFRPASSTEPIATAHGSATLECTEEIQPSPSNPAFVWDRYEVKFGTSQPMTVLGPMLRDRRSDISVERLVESHWDLGENPIGGFQSFISHVIANSQNFDIMRADEADLSEEWW
jgi:hypothetical protein